MVENLKKDKRFKLGLVSSNKELVKEWNWNKNVNLEPDKVTLGSGKKVWWKCKKCDYEWMSAICDRKRGKGMSVLC